MIGNSCAAEWIAKQILVEWRRYCYCTRVNNTVFVRRHRLDCWKDSVLSTVRRQGCHFDHTYASAPDNRHEEYFIARWAQSLKTLVWDLINMQNVLNHVSDRSSHLTGKQQIFFTIWSIVPSVLWRCWLGGRKGIRPVKKMSGEVLTWLSVWSEVQTCICPADATATHCLLLQQNPDWFYLSGTGPPG